MRARNVKTLATLELRRGLSTDPAPPRRRILDLRDLLASLHGRLGDGFETRDRDIDYRDIDYRDMNMEQTLDETVALLRDMLRNVDKRDQMLGSNDDNDND